MAKFGIKDDWEINLKIGEFDVVPNLDNVVSIMMRSHIHMDLPTLTYSFRDRGGQYLFNNVGHDGALVDFSVKTTDDEYENQFLCLGGPNGGGGESDPFMSQVAVLNHPAWMRKIIDQPFIKTLSKDVMAQLASMAGLDSDVDTTSDKMTWLPNNTPLGSYARFVSKKGWINEETALLMAVTEQSKVMYKDLKKVVDSPAKKTISLNDGDLNYIDWSINDKRPIYNTSRGYGFTSIVPNPVSMLNISSNMAQAIDQIESSVASVTDVADKLGVSGVASEINELKNKVTNEINDVQRKIQSEVSQVTNAINEGISKANDVIGTINGIAGSLKRMGELNQISIPLIGEGLKGIGEPFLKGVGKLGVRVEGTPLDAGNTHPYYHLAEHQNKRVKSLFGFDCKVLIPGATGLELMDIVDFQPINNGTKEVIETIAGHYIVTGKNRIIQNMMYWECLILTAQ